MKKNIATISIIAAVSENGVIGVGNKLPWNLPDDLNFFRSKTLDKYIIMGRNTFESIGRKLYRRNIIVLTTDTTYSYPGVIVVDSLAKAIAITRLEDEVFIIGGGMLFKDTIDIADKMYLTMVHVEIRGDVYFPFFDMSKWEEVSSVYHEKDSKHQYSFTFKEFKRIS